MKPLRIDYQQALAKSTAKQRDDIIRIAVSSVLGDDWTAGILAGRLVCHVLPSGDEVFHLDGKPILEMKPLRIEYKAENGSFVVTATQPYRVISAPPEDVGQR